MNTNCLLLHGLAQNNKGLEPIKHIIEKNNLNCFAPELPGHRSTLPKDNEVNYQNWELELDTLVKYLSRDFNDRILIVGHSFGSLLALKLSQKYPQTVLGLILISPSIKLRNPKLNLILECLRFIPDFIVKKIPNINKSSISNKHTNSKDYYCFNILKHLSQLRHEVLKGVDKIRCPIYIIQNLNDYHLSPISSLKIKENYAKENIKLIVKDFGNNHNLADLPEIDNLVSESIKYIYSHSQLCQEK